MAAQRNSKASKRKASPKKPSAKGSSKKGSAKASGASSKKAPKRSKPASKASAGKAKAPLGKASKDKERARLQKERERALKEKERERAAKEKEKERDRLAKEKERAAKEKEKERDRLAKEKERAAKEKEKDKARELKEREKLKAQEAKQREAEKKKKEAEKEAAKKAAAAEIARKAAEKEAQKAREKAEKEAQKAREKAEKEAQKAREKTEREAEREREKAEREAERIRLKEEAQRKREEEAAAKKAAQDAYRKAKDQEKSRIRAEREAARRALEGRVAKAVGKGMRGAARAGTATTVRVYNPAVIPDQSRTRRSVMDQDPYAKFANLRAPKIDTIMGEPPKPRTVPPPPPEAPPENIEERYALVTERLKKVDDAFRREHDENFLMSWIYHDSALEGMVYTYEELRTAINPNISVVPDSSMQSVVDEIRRHKAAIDLVLELGDKKRAPVSIDVVKRLYLTLHPEEGDLKTVKYRKDIPQHRLYFHEYAAPDKIAYKIRQVFDWLNGPEPKKLKSALKVAARVHYDLLRVFPFPNDSGKVARLLMNILLLRSDHPPAIIHSTERQRYYEALRGSLVTIISMVQESILNALQSIEKKLDEHETKMKAFVS